MASDDDSELALGDGQAEAWTLFASALEPAEPAPELRSKLLQALRGTERFAPFTAEVSSTFGLPPEAVRAVFTRITDASAWQPGFWPGSSILLSPELLQAGTVLARMAAATRVPVHNHPVRELTYVLDGLLTENDGRTLGPGELLAMNPGDRHAIAVGGDHECLVVFALQRTA